MIISFDFDFKKYIFVTAWGEIPGLPKKELIL
jgi:hypothetical protein